MGVVQTIFYLFNLIFFTMFIIVFKATVKLLHY